MARTVVAGASRWIRLGASIDRGGAGDAGVPCILAGGGTRRGEPGSGEYSLSLARRKRLRGAESTRGFESDATESGEVVETVNLSSPHLLVVGLGAPRQEIWLRQYAPRLNARVAIAAGATIDFLAGVQRRAPRWVQQARLEWLFRLATDPRRLAGRYARDAVVFPRLVAAEWRRVRAEAARQV